MFKGEPNRNGRPKGAKNRATEKVREAFTLLVENNLEQMQTDITALQPKERLRVIIDLSSYILPKLKQVDLATETNYIKGFNIKDIYSRGDLVEKLLDIDSEVFDKLD